MTGPVVRRPLTTMTAAQSIPLTLLPLTVIARETGYSRSMVRNWMLDDWMCPPDIRDWLARRAASMVHDPAPRKVIGRPGRPSGVR